jgi:hypothetical protein
VRFKVPLRLVLTYKHSANSGHIQTEQEGPHRTALIYLNNNTSMQFVYDFQRNDRVVVYEITPYNVEGGFIDRKIVKIYSKIRLPFICHRWIDGRTASREIFCTFRYE